MPTIYWQGEYYHVAPETKEAIQYLDRIGCSEKAKEHITFLLKRGIPLVVEQSDQKECLKWVQQQHGPEVDMKKYEYAKKICEFLENKRVYSTDDYLWVTTTNILDAITSEDKNWRPETLKLLHAMTEMGVLARRGSPSKYEWKMKNKLWDRYNPLDTPRTSGQDPPATRPSPNKREQKYTIEGYIIDVGNPKLTWQHKEEIAKLGCKWSQAEKKWVAPDMYNFNQAFALMGLPAPLKQPQWKIIPGSMGTKPDEITGNEEMPDDPAPAEETAPQDDGKLAARVTELETQVQELEGEVLSTNRQLKHVRELAERSIRVLEIKRIDLEPIIIKDAVLPAVFEEIRELAEIRENILLVGPAGCGKTFIARFIADTLGLDFGSISCTSGMSESHLLGRSVPDISKGKSTFQSTKFLHCYEEGGLFLLDEVDGADSNMMLSLNPAIANDYCNVPNRPMKPEAKKHADFVMIAAANTYGRGADRVYAGRNQLDEATLDRFRAGIVECTYDPVVEAALCPDDELRGRLQHIRKRIEEQSMRRILSTRFLISAYKMKKALGKSDDQIVDRFFRGWSRDERLKVSA